MTQAMVPWKTLDPGVTETLVSVMLLRQRPFARRLRPGRGDGGVDVYEPAPGGWLIDQIKYFANNLENSEKQQIAHSLKRVKEHFAAKNQPVAEWRLVMPLDPTPDNETWFADLTKEIGFPCRWVGLTALEGLASQYPDVVDYLIGNGQQRVTDMVKTVVTALGLQGRLASAAADGTLTPAATQDDLRNLFRLLDQSDPYYRYAFSVEPLTSPPMDLTSPAASDPMLVAAVQRSDSECRVTYRIYARYEQAVEDRPITIQTNVQTAPGSESAAALKDFTLYGAPADISASDGAVISIDADLPGGLGGLLAGGRLRIGPAIDPAQKPKTIRLQTLTPTGVEIAVTRLVMQPTSVGLDRTGILTPGHEENGVFDFAIRMNFATQTVQFSFALKDLTGLHPSDTLAGLRVLHSFHKPNMMRFAEAHGPIVHNADHIPGSAVEVGPILAIVEALEALQQHTIQQITIPRLDQLGVASAREILETAKLVSEGSIPIQWNEITTAPPADPTQEDYAPHPLMVELPLAVTVGEQKIDLGHRRILIESARMEQAGPPSDSANSTLLRWVPGDNDRAIVQYIPPA